jgi:DNA-binding transcriptional LysR family regulator
MDIELRHLRQFVAVAEEGHITRAAERLGMQQPPLSQRIKAIENELGVQLFQRKARGIELTEAGRVFLDRSRTIIARYDEAFEAARSTARGEQGSLRVGVTPTAPFHPFVPFVIRAFRDSFPRVSLTMDECLRIEALERLRADQMDVAFLAFLQPSIDGSPDLVVNSLFTEPMVVALPSSHILAHGECRDRPITLKSLADETFIVYARQLGPTFYEMTMSACLEAGFTPRLGQETARVTSALSLVAVGLGVALVPACMQRMMMDGVVYRQLKGAGHPKAVLNLATKRGNSSALLRNFATLVHKAAREFQSEDPPNNN